MMLIVSVPHTGTRSLLFHLSQLVPGRFHMFGPQSCDSKNPLLWGHFYPVNEQLILQLARERCTFIPMRDPVLSFLTTYHDTVPRHALMRVADGAQRDIHRVPTKDHVIEALERQWECWGLFGKLFRELRTIARTLVVVDVNQMRDVAAGRYSPSKYHYRTTGQLPPVFEQIGLTQRLKELRAWLATLEILFD